MTQERPVDAMTTDYRAMCAELLEALEGRRFCYGAILDSARAALAQPEPQPPADGEVAKLVAWLRLESEDWRQANPRGYQGARLTRTAELLEHLASDNAGLTAAADSLWADNASLLDN